MTLRESSYRIMADCLWGVLARCRREWLDGERDRLYDDEDYKT